MMRTHSLKIMILCLSAAFAPPLAAQADNARPQGQNNSTALDNVIVTARGLQEKNLDVPFTVHLIGGGEVKKRGFVSSEDVLRSVPGTDLYSSGDVADSNIMIRGVGSLSHTGLDDQSVAVRIDGAGYGILGLSQNLYDVRQIEIAKGPQGTLFGSNSEAGAINIQTHHPEPVLDANIETGFGSDKLKTVQGMINVPLAKNLSARIAAIARWQDDYLHDRQSGKPLNTQSNQGIRAKLLWRPDDSTEVLLSTFYDQRRNYLPMFVAYPFADPPLYTAGKLPHDSRRGTNGLSLHINRRHSGWQWQSMSAFNRHRADTNRAYLPLDTLPVHYQILGVPPAFYPTLDAFFDNPAHNAHHQADRVRNFEQEFRFSSLPESRVAWVGGVYLNHRKRDFLYHGQRKPLLIMPGLPAYTDAYNADLQRNYRTDTQAIFGEITYPVTDALKWNLGLRLTHERIRARTRWQPNPDPQNQPFAAFGRQSNTQHISDTFLTGRSGFNYALDNTWHVYGQYTRGHKSAGFADFATNIAYGGIDKPYRAGSVDAFEAGIKGAAEDDRWGANLALFHSRIKNDHINVIHYPIPTVETFNADTRSRGFEVDAFVRPVRAWRIKAALSYIDARVTHAPAKNQHGIQAGDKVMHVPTWSASVGTEYRHALPFANRKAQWFVRADTRFVGKRTGYGHGITTKAYTLLDVATGIEGAHHKVSLWAKNLNNARWAYYTMGFNGITSSGVPAPGRSYGLNYRYDL